MDNFINQNGNRLPLIEALIISSPEPLATKRILEMVEDTSPAELDQLVSRLNEKYVTNDISFRIRKIAGGYQVYIIEDFARYVEELHTRRKNMRLTRSALETMAIIAYRQPVTKIEIETIRGVASDSVIHTLLERKLITLAGRSQSIGRPLLYRTTEEFLKYFNLNSIDDLPKMAEIEELLSMRDGDNQPSLPFENPVSEKNSAAESEPEPDKVASDTATVEEDYSELDDFDDEIDDEDDDMVQEKDKLEEIEALENQS
jgi:segregation and condensation protein B